MPVQVAPGADPQHGAALSGIAASPEIQHTAQMRVVPSSDQQHRLPPEAFGRLMPVPASAGGWVLSQPTQAHAVGVVPLQQRQTLIEIAAVIEAAADVIRLKAEERAAVLSAAGLLGVEYLTANRDVA